MKLQRRDLLKAALAGGTLGVGGLVGFDPVSRMVTGPGIPGSPQVGPAGSMDAFEILKDAIRQGKRLNFGGAPALAAGNDDTVVVTIKVMNHIHSPLCFKMGKTTLPLGDAANTVMPYTGAGMIPWETKFGNQACLTLLRGKGLDMISDNPRWQRLRMNKWWADIVDTGKIETGAAPTIISAADVGPFPAESDVAVQALFGVSQTNLQLNHSIQNCSMAKSTDAARGGDLANHVAMQKIIMSPLGLVCFNMGVVVETDNGNVPMRIYGSDLTGVVATGRPVVEYVSVLRQAIGLGLVDDDLATKVNQLASLDSTLLTELRKSRVALTNALATLNTASALESSLSPNVANAGNLQAIGTSPDQAAKAEFLGQVKFVQRALEIPGRPLRNFTLFLNIVDIDGGKLDAAAFISQPANPVSYVEGMRQLGVGLNMLAQVIKSKKNVYVMVVSEGGRAANRGDNKSSFAMLMGPGGAGNIKDYLYYNKASTDSTTDPHVADPNAGNANFTGLGSEGQRIPDGPVLVTEAGTALADQITNAAFLGGVVKHLEMKQGLPQTTQGLGKRVVIQTG